MTLLPLASYATDPDARVYETAAFIRAAKGGEVRDSEGTAYPVVAEEVVIDHVILCEFVPANIPLNASQILWITT